MDGGRRERAVEDLKVSVLICGDMTIRRKFISEGFGLPVSEQFNLFGFFL
jgi:hypothetical protein